MVPLPRSYQPCQSCRTAPTMQQSGCLPEKPLLRPPRSCMQWASGSDSLKRGRKGSDRPYVQKSYGRSACLTSKCARRRPNFTRPCAAGTWPYLAPAPSSGSTHSPTRRRSAWARPSPGSIITFFIFLIPFGLMMSEVTRRVPGRGRLVRLVSHVVRQAVRRARDHDVLALERDLAGRHADRP